MKKNKLFRYGSYVIISLGILACGRTEPSGHAKEQSDPPKVESTPKSQPSSGWDVGGGGDAYSGEFVEIANEIATILEMQTITGLTSEIFRTAIKNTKIISKDMVEIEQRVVDAANFPEATPPRIEVSRSGWLRMKNEKHNKVFLVLHEYLGILKMDDTNYAISRQLNPSNVCSRSFKVRLALESHIDKPCYLISLTDLGNLEKLSFRDQKIEELASHDFDYLVNLKYLNLDGNPLKALSDGAFKELVSLVGLSLRHTELSILTNHAFDGLSNLESLDLSSSPISSLQENTFKEMTKITMVVFDSQVAGRRDSLDEFFRPGGVRFEGANLTPVGFWESVGTLTNLDTVLIFGAANLSEMPKKIEGKVKSYPTPDEIREDKLSNSNF